MSAIAKLSAAPLAICLSSMAFAQATSPAYVEVKDGAIIVQEFNARVEQMEDFDVYDGAGNRVGDVEDVLGMSPGAPVAVGVDADHYLGQEGDDVVLSFGDLKLQDGRLVTSLNKDAISKLQRFND